MYQANDKDRILARQIISEECMKHNLNFTEDTLEDKVTEVLNISSSIGGGYDEKTLRKITQSMLKKGYFVK